jgi:predicted RNase H-like nuclease
MTRWVAGADGCPPGWAVVLVDLDAENPPELFVCADFAEVLRHPKLPGLIAVDMPIGLPETTGVGGRGPEAELRQHLGDRQSSVFSIPSRSAVMAESFEAACEASLATSDPPRKISIQAFNLFPKIRQIDALLRSDPGLTRIVHEVHPEGAFMVMNGREPLSEPKKVKSVAHEPGLSQRKLLLNDVAGFPMAFLDQKPPKGVGIDDFLDACACAHVARRIARGEALSFPETPARDAFGIPIAIKA